MRERKGIESGANAGKNARGVGKRKGLIIVWRKISGIGFEDLEKL